MKLIDQIKELDKTFPRLDTADLCLIAPRMAMVLINLSRLLKQLESMGQKNSDAFYYLEKVIESSDE